MKSWSGGHTLRAWRLDGQPFPGYEALPCPADMAETPERGHVMQAGSVDWVWPTTGGAVAVAPLGDPGHFRPGFPVPVASGRLRLRLADVDGDGVDEVLGGVDEGATGRWFLLRARAGDPVLSYTLTPSPVTAAPAPAQLAGDSAPELVVPMRAQIECRTSDGAGGYAVLPGWPVQPVVGGAGDAGTLAFQGGGRCVMARGPSGGLSAYSAQGALLAQWSSATRLGARMDYADLPAGSGTPQWAAHSLSAGLRLASDAGADSAGRPRICTLELGDRHHTVYVSAPAGLLPPVRCRLWVNGRELTGPASPVRLSETDVTVHGVMEDARAAGNPTVDVLVCRGLEIMGRGRGVAGADVRLTLESGHYTALAVTQGDTLARQQFEVAAPLALQDVYNYPNPMKDRTDFLFRLSRAARVHVDIFTVSGRRVRSLGGDFPLGRAQLSWDGRDALGQATANGVYLFRIAASSGEERVQDLGKLIRLN